jgi:hypothetical protein
MFNHHKIRIFTDFPRTFSGISPTSSPGKAAAFIPNLYGALDQGEEGDIVSRSIVCCKSGNPAGDPSLETDGDPAVGRSW